MDPNQMMMLQALQQSGPMDGAGAPPASIAATQQSSLGTSGMHPQDMYGALMQPPPAAPQPQSPY